MDTLDGYRWNEYDLLVPIDEENDYEEQED